ncbi:ligase-associated DNA damage response endonuclease PdeM [Ningiella sp. W23]|uniref:ligase-associated DNA damage response endonuclease PdeM n=1 Tax=Ningiella sp. W23 TaxID=3023715 RepID=UPI003757E3EE
MIAQEQLKQYVLDNTIIPVKFCDHKLIVDGRAVLFWPAHDLLVFSDLHFEKGSFLSQFAHPLPRFDTRETIKRMEHLISIYQPSVVICLGDSFHDGNAGSRLESDDIAAINDMVRSVTKWIWVLGNHDPDIPESLLGKRQHHCIFSGVLFVHEPEEISTFKAMNGEFCDSQIVGHYHPKTSYKLSHKKLTDKSFIVGEDLLLMPAFGKYTGGLNSNSEVIKSLFDGKKMQILLTYHTKLFML